MAAICRSPRPACRSSIAPSSSATASMKSAWCADGALIDEARHLARLKTSLAALRIAAPVGEAALKRILREVVARNRVGDGLVYLQISRGVARRDHGFPAARRRAGAGRHGQIARSSPGRGQRRARRGGDHHCRTSAGRIRTSRSLQLLPNVLAKQAAREAGRLRGVARRRRGLRHRGLFDQRLDRLRRRRAGDAPGRSGDPARRHAHDADRHRRRRRPPLRGAPVHPRGGVRRATRPSFPALRQSPPRSSPSTAGRSATAARARLTTALRRKFAAAAARS